MGGLFQMQGTEKNAAQSMPSSLSNMIFRTWGTTSITSGGENRRLLSIAHADVILELVCGQQGLSNSGGLQGRPFANFLSSLNCRNAQQSPKWGRISPLDNERELLLGKRSCHIPNAGHECLSDGKASITSKV